MATIYKHEPALFGIAAIISALVWMVLIFGTMGIALIYVLFFLLIYLFVQSAFIARIKGTAVRITPEQFPDLHQRITKCCELIELQPQPEAYLLHAHGVFNALATRFLGRHFIVLYSDVVDALDKHPDAVNFYIGHELGHLHRKHLVWGPWLWPAGMLPLLGAAYSRSREYTCDLYGLRCCPDAQTAMRGLAALSAGHNRWQSLDIDQYVAQVSHTGGFWMAFHELISDYPWLVKRMAQIKAPGDQSNVPNRNFFAWLLAMFIPRIGMGGGGASVLIVVAIIGILAAVALPAYQDYTTRAKIMGAVSYGRAATQAVENYVIEKNAIPQHLEDAGVAAPTDPMIQSATIDGRNGIIQVVLGPGPAEGKSILFIPSRGADKNITWQCASNDIAAKLLPLQCRPPQQK